MSLQSVADVPLIITSPNSSSERRINPSWTIAHLKSRLEVRGSMYELHLRHTLTSSLRDSKPITGIPAGSQQLALRIASQDAVSIAAVDEEKSSLAAFPLQPYAEITVSATLLSYCSATRALSLNIRPSQPLISCHISLLFPSSAHPSIISVCVSDTLLYDLLSFSHSLPWSGL
jgi:hypothetical protein